MLAIRAVCPYTACLSLSLEVFPSGGGTSSRFQSRAAPRLMSATVTVNNCGRSIRFPFGQPSKQPQPLQGTEYSNQFNNFHRAFTKDQVFLYTISAI